MRIIKYLKTIGHSKTFLAIILKRIILALILIVCFSSSAKAGYSIITESEGYSCLNIEKTRRQTEYEARAAAVRSAHDHAANIINTKRQDFIIEYDAPSVIAGASNIQELSKIWDKDSKAGDCVKVIVRAEFAEFTLVNPRTMNELKMIVLDDIITDDPTAPLNIKMWPDKKEYRQSEQIRFLMKGNKPFYAKILYKDSTGRLLQIHPSTCRADNFFHGRVVYEIPSYKDCFEIKADGSATEESIILYASTSQIGDLEVERAGNVFTVKTTAKELPQKVREIKFDTKLGQKGNLMAEFIEKTLKLKIIQ